VVSGQWSVVSGEFDFMLAAP
jgi:hypothetical protein